jgi:hypothetical protein
MAWKIHSKHAGSFMILARLGPAWTIMDSFSGRYSRMLPPATTTWKEAKSVPADDSLQFASLFGTPISPAAKKKRIKNTSSQAVNKNRRNADTSSGSSEGSRSNSSDDGSSSDRKKKYVDKKKRDKEEKHGKHHRSSSASSRSSSSSESDPSSSSSSSSESSNDQKNRKKKTRSRKKLSKSSRRWNRANESTLSGADPSTGNKKYIYSLPVTGVEIDAAMGPHDLRKKDSMELYNAAVDKMALQGMLGSTRGSEEMSEDASNSHEMAATLIASTVGQGKQSSSVHGSLWQSNRCHALSQIRD